MANYKDSLDMKYDSIQLQWPNQKSADDEVQCEEKERERERTVIRENWYAMQGKSKMRYG